MGIRMNITLDAKGTERAIRIMFISRVANAIDVLFASGFMLLYFSALGVPSERILLYFSLPALLQIVTILPFAHWAERIGKVRLGVIAESLTTATLPLLIVIGLAPKPLVEPLIALGSIVAGLAAGMYTNSWFPLVSPIVPVQMRGRFFGLLRVMYQSIGIALAFAVMLVLGKKNGMEPFLYAIALAFVVRLICILVYARIPELERQPQSGRTFRNSLAHVIGTPGYMPFCAYIFLLSLATGACGSLFALLAKDTLGFSQHQIILIGNLATFGALAGFFVGGLLVDKAGTKLVFLVCHFSYALILMLFPVRDFLPFPVLAIIGGLALVFGLIQAASGIAISSEMLSLIPVDNKPMALAVAVALQSLGFSLSGVFASLVLKHGMLSPTWALCGRTLGAYDTLLCFSGLAVLLLVVTLGLVPSVVKKVQWG